jgi:hypothetical protein
VFNSSSISIKKDAKLHILPEASHRKLLEEAGRLYGATSNYVHFTRAQIDERIARVDAGRTAGKESEDDVVRLNELLSRVFSAALVFLFHSVPEYVAGDWFVEYDGSTVNWYFTGSQFMATLHEHFEYKHERKERLSEIREARAAAIAF